MFDILLQRTDSSSVPEVCLQLNTAENTLENLREFVTAVVARVKGAYLIPQLFQFSSEMIMLIIMLGY